MNTSKNKIDLNALKFNQASIIILTALGFILNEPILTAAVAVVLIAGSIDSRLAVFKQFYRYVVLPFKILRPNIAEESSAPHNFAQTLGGIFLSIGSVLLFENYSVPGWIFAWIVILLAAANLAFGFCTGCFIYFQLGKFGVPGFHVRSNS